MRQPEEEDREGGLIWTSSIGQDDVCLGLGEKAAPLDLKGRRWELDTTNAVSTISWSRVLWIVQVPKLEASRAHVHALFCPAGPLRERIGSSFAPCD